MGPNARSLPISISRAVHSMASSRGARRAPRRLIAIPLGEGAEPRRPHMAGPHHRPARRAFSVTPRAGGAESREQLPGCGPKRQSQQLRGHSITRSVADYPHAGVRCSSKLPRSPLKGARAEYHAFTGSGRIGPPARMFLRAERLGQRRRRACLTDTEESTAPLRSAASLAEAAQSPSG